MSLHEAVQGFISEKEASGELHLQAGVAVSIVRGLDVFYQGTFGWSDRASKLPVTSKTQFEVSSLTKAVTATAFVMGSEEGRLDLSAPFNLEQMRLQLSDLDVTRTLSCVDILSHRTALPAHDCLWYFGPSRTDELVSAIRHLELIPNGFRTSFNYSNLMYAALGSLSDDLLGSPWEKFVGDRVFQPLGMHSTALYAKADSAATEVARGYVREQAIPTKCTNSIAAAGGMKSNIEDMNRWMMFQLEHGSTISGNVQLLSSAGLGLMQSAQIAIEQPNPLLFQGLGWLGIDALSYGLGWFLGKTRGMKAVFHMGFIDGFSTVMVLIPELDVGITVLTNFNLSPFPGQLANHLLGCILREEHMKISSKPAAAESASDVHTAVSVDPSMFVGDFLDSAYGKIYIREQNDKLNLRYRDQDWHLSFQDAHSATFVVSAFGLNIPVPATFTVSGNVSSRISIPFSLDPRVGAQNSSAFS